MFGAPIRTTNDIERQQQGSQTTQVLDAGCTANEAAPPPPPLDANPPPVFRPTLSRGRLVVVTVLLYSLGYWVNKESWSEAGIPM